MRIRISSGDDLFSEDIGRGERALAVREVTSGTSELVGLIEYVGIKLRGGKGTAYGWRPVLSGWTASRLATQLDAARALARKAA